MRKWNTYLTPEEKELLKKYCGRTWYDWTILMTVRRLLILLERKSDDRTSSISQDSRI